MGFPFLTAVFLDGVLLDTVGLSVLLVAAAVIIARARP